MNARRIYITKEIMELARKQKLEQVNLYFDIGANSCVFACNYCWLQKQGRRLRMNIETLRDVIDWMRIVSPIERPRIHFFGMEPLMRWDLIVEARKYAPDLPMSLTTNGYLLDDRKIQWLCDNDVRVFVFSIDGAEEYQALRPLRVKDENSWYRVSENLRKICETKQREWLTARATWDPETDYDLVRRFDVLLSLGAKNVEVIPVTTSHFDEDKTARAYEELAEYFNYRFPPSGTITRMLKRIIQAPESPPGNSCKTGEYAWGIDPVGNVYICHGYIEDPGKRITNIYTGKVNWRAFNTSEIVDSFHTENMRYPKEECKTCPAYNYCMGVGFCGVWNELATGHADVPPDGYCNHLRGMIKGLKKWASYISWNNIFTMVRGRQWQRSKQQ